MAKLKIKTVKRAILEYLFRKPEREYPLMEIVEWWMEEQREKIRVALQQYIDQEIVEINSALNEMKDSGLIEEVTSYGEIRYRITQDGIEEIQNIIE